jgi:putative DNA primase/helicase
MTTDRLFSRLAAAGADVSRLDPHRIGVWQRLPREGRSTGLPYYVMIHRLHPLLASIGDWRSGWSETLADDRPMDHAERKRLQRETAQRRRDADRDRAERERKAADIVRAEWQACGPADDHHPYLRRKGVRAHGLRDLCGELFVPMRDADGALWSRQTIMGDGVKLFMRGARKKGLFHCIGQVDSMIAIAEGYATAATVHEATGWPVAVAFDCGNLEPVAEALRRKFGKQKIIVTADNDAATPGNPGVTKGRQAAAKVGGVCIWPTFRPGDSGTDWNDYQTHYGREGVAWALSEALGGLRHG